MLRSDPALHSLIQIYVSNISSLIQIYVSNISNNDNPLQQWNEFLLEQLKQTTMNNYRGILL